MRRDTIKYAIVKELERYTDFVYAGKISTELGYILKAKPSNIERRMRELANGGRLETKMLKNPKGGNEVVGYKIKKLGEIVEGTTENGYRTVYKAIDKELSSNEFKQKTLI